MSRYAEVLAPVALRIGRERRGWCFVQCVAGEQVEVAACLGQLLGLPVAAVSDDVEPFNECVVHLVPRQEAALRDAALSSINGRRDRLSDRGRFILVASRLELKPLQRYAADIFSVLRFVEEVSLVPRQLGAEELAAARRQLAAWYRERFGRLDLRGFIRSETEDASFAVEEIFEPLEATEQRRDDERAPALDSTRASEVAHVRSMNLGKPLLELVGQAREPCLILGGPGSGKSFFLRWCALKASAAIEARARDAPLFGEAAPIPVFISLAAVGLMPGRPALADYALELLLTEGLTLGHTLPAAAEEGRALFLLDGLDETGAAGLRRAAWAAVVELVTRYPRARVLVTSRPGVMEELAADELEGVGTRVLSISPLSESAIGVLLVRWCELYELHREGTPAARQRGRTLGESLAQQVLDSPAVQELATSPLLVTIIAIVHRAGVRLPDRRVELYEHAFKILVERWNQARTRDNQTGSPLRLPDAIRLLGPVALEMIERNREGAIDEASLEELLRSSLAAGNVRRLQDASAALELFRNSLGLLVERAPGIYGFLHQTFVEYLAAHELVRTGRFLALAKSARKAYAPKWREVVLLGAGVLGVLQVNDEELGAVVKALVTNARQRKGNLSPEVPQLLGALLADDPALSTSMVQNLIEELIPRWWFEEKYPPSRMINVLSSAASDFERIAQGPWHSVVKQRMEDHYAAGIDSISSIHDEQVRFLAIHALDRLEMNVALFVCNWYFDRLDAEGRNIFEVSFDKVETLAKLDESVFKDPASPKSFLVEAKGGVRLSSEMKILLRHTWDTELWTVADNESDWLSPLRSVNFDGELVEVVYVVQCSEGGPGPSGAELIMWSTTDVAEDIVGKVRAAYREICAARQPSGSPPDENA